MYSPKLPITGFSIFSISGLLSLQLPDWTSIVSILLFCIILGIVMFRFLRLIWKERIKK